MVSRFQIEGMFAYSTGSWIEVDTIIRTQGMWSRLNRIALECDDNRGHSWERRPDLRVYQCERCLSAITDRELRNAWPQLG